MIRRAVGAGVLAIVLATGAAAAAAVPDGPRLAVVKASFEPPRLELVTIGPKGGNALRLAGGGRRSRLAPSVFSSVSWSANGETIAFGGASRGGGGHKPFQGIFVVRADGTGLRPFPGTEGGSGPVLSPDGATVAFTRGIYREGPTTVAGKRWEDGFRGSSIWIADLATGARRQLTPWRDEQRYAASSFSPDGSTLLATHEDELLLREAEPVAIGLDGSGTRRLLDDGFSPVYSPDGSRIALIRRIVEYGKSRGEENAELFVVRADGSGIRRLTRTPERDELSPGWDPSGERLAYVRLPANRSEDAIFGYRTPLMEINADGSCQTKVVSARQTYFFAPAWQPGPGREAGRIEC